jgi:hypothetical protein
LALAARQALAGSRRRAAARWLEQLEGAAPQVWVSLLLRRPVQAPVQVPAMEQARRGVRQVRVALLWALWALWALPPGSSRSRR